MTRVVPGAEPFNFHGGPIGFLLLHGLSGSPAGMRQIGEWLAARGHAVSCPRYPGHGTSWKELARTRWQDWAAEATRALKELDRRCDHVSVMGLSVGGAMALHLAARYPDVVRSVVGVNPLVRDPRLLVAVYLWMVIPPRKGITNDIKKPDQDEIAYDRFPVRALGQLQRFLKIVERELPRVRQPLLVFNSLEDHIVPKGNAEWLLGRVGSTDKELVELTNSYHVATLDHDAELIFERTHEFAEAHAVGVGHGEEALEEESVEPSGSQEAAETTGDDALETTGDDSVHAEGDERPEAEGTSGS